MPRLAIALRGVNICSEFTGGGLYAFMKQYIILLIV